MKSLILFLSLVSLSASAETICKLTEIKNGNEYTSDLSEVTWGKAVKLSNGSSFTIMSDRVGIDAFDEYIDVKSETGKELNCARQMIFINDLYKGMRADCGSFSVRCFI